MKHYLKKKNKTYDLITLYIPQYQIHPTTTANKMRNYGNVFFKCIGRPVKLNDDYENWKQA